MKIISHIKKSILLYLLIILTVFQHQILFAQSVSLPIKPSVSEYIFDEVKFPNGASIRDVFDITQDKSGFIWIATRHGLLKYDGHDIKTYQHNIHDKNSIIDSNTSKLFLYRDSLLFIGCAEGFSILNLINGKFKNYVFDNGTCPTKEVLDFLPDEKGQIWFAGMSGLYSLSSDFKKITDHKLELPPNKLSKTARKNQVLVIKNHPFDKNILLLGTACGLVSFDKNKNKIYKTFPNNEINNTLYSLNSIYNIQFDGNYAWCRSWIAGLNRFDLKSEQWKNYFFTTTNNKIPMAIYSYLIKNKDEIWISDARDQNGFGVLNKNTGKTTFEKQIYSTNNSTNKHFISNLIYLQSDSTLWLSNYEGQYLFRQNKKINRFRKLDIPYPKLWVSDFYYDKSTNDYYFGFIIYSKGIGRWNANTKKWTLVKPIGNPDLIDFPVYTLFSDSKGVLWAGMGLRNLWYVDKEKNEVRPFRLANGKPIENEGSSVLKIFEDSKKQLWIGTGINGVIRLNESRTHATNFKHKDGDSTSLIEGTHFRSIEEDNQGRIWIGNMNGFCVYDPKTNKFSQQIAKQLKTTGVRSGFTYSILKDTLGRMWMTVMNLGLVRITEKPIGKFHFKIYQTDDGLKDLITTYMTRDKNGCFWIVNNGLLYFNPYNESYMVTDNKNGLLENFGGDDKILVDDFGNVFCGDQVGLNWQNEVQKYSKSSVLNLLIEQVSVNGNPIEKNLKNKKIVLASNQNNITFNYTAVCFEETDQIRYRYKLESIEENWNPPTTILEAHYMQLKPGNYRFIVDVSYKGKWLNKNSFVEFKIEQVFWKKWWFILIVLFIIGLIVFTILRYRFLHYLRMQKIRGKIASDLHDDIGSTLSSISIMSDLLQMQVENSSKAKEMIHKIGSNAHNMLDSMDDTIWSVNPSNDKFQNMDIRLREYAIPLFESKEIQFQIISSSELSKLHLSMDVRKNIFLIAKEAINNLIKYSQCTEVKISFNISHSTLVLEINDNGVGFDTALESNRNGLSNMKKRAEQINGKLSVRSEIGKGTQVLLAVKII